MSQRQPGGRKRGHRDASGPGRTASWRGWPGRGRAESAGKGKPGSCQKACRTHPGNSQMLSQPSKPPKNLMIFERCGFAAKKTLKIKQMQQPNLGAAGAPAQRHVFCFRGARWRIFEKRVSKHVCLFRPDLLSCNSTGPGKTRKEANV